MSVNKFLPYKYAILIVHFKYMYRQNTLPTHAEQDLKHHFHSGTYHDVAVLASNLNGITALIHSLIQRQPKAAIGQNMVTKDSQIVQRNSHICLSLSTASVLSTIFNSHKTRSPLHSSRVKTCKKNQQKIK